MERSSAKRKRRKRDVRLGGESDEREDRGWLLWRKEEEEENERSVAGSSDVHRLVDASVEGDDGTFLPTDDNRPRKK